MDELPRQTFALADPNALTSPPAVIVRSPDATDLRPAAKGARRETDERAKELEHPVQDDADEPEREQQKPHDGVDEECDECQRPADDQEDQPE